MSSDNQKSFVEQSGASDESLQQVHHQLQSRKPEKSTGYAAFPLVLLGLRCTAVFFSSIYLAHYSAHFDSMIYNEHQKPAKGGAAAVVVTPAQLGKRVFSTTCIACHQATGEGVPGVYPPLKGSEWAQGDEQRIIRIVLHGLNGPITVEGKDFNNAMASLGGVLKDDQIANVLTYVRQEWGNNAPPVSVETVTKVRAETAGRTGPWTVDELKKIGQ
ncbi:MAG TPA: cytochrome c [Candidatus Didemnitutus sp.]|nr:cytochrome c [Candidatus Didemnitutus sp.]